jgi:23S rRNA (adenine2503-C2)-methyltransferase
MPLNILDHTHDQFVEAFRRQTGKGAHTSNAIYRRVMKFGEPGQAGWERDVRLPADHVVKRIEDDGVVKFSTRLADGLDIESVVIPMFKRNTLCVSSQVGCRMGCRFCRTGNMGLIRDLTPAEIVGQVFNARHWMDIDVRNVVFMGMGEPLDNLSNVVQAIRVLEDQRGLDIARRYITVSTVGLTAGIDRLGQMDGPSVNLAVSLNAPSDAIRSAIMPVNRSNPMSVLREALSRYPIGRKASFVIEYVLIRGVNDQEAHARTLVQYLTGMPVKVNLIAFNPFPGSDLQAPSTAAYERFHGWLVDAGVFVRRRGKKGECIMAACGQLGGTAK